jgi:hypothetical protein
VTQRVKPSIDKVVAQAMRKVLKTKVRRQRVKTEADVWFEKMKADFKVNGAEHLASAKAKMGE